MPRLPRQFYERSTFKVAPDLLGQFLVRQVPSNREQARPPRLRRRRAGRVTKWKTIITEVEAYVGEGDPACHACRGRTKRNEVMYGAAGRAYVYFIYGMYYCLNIVTERLGFPSAVLVRGAVPVKSKVKNQKSKEMNGPGKLCQQLKIDKRLNGVDLTQGEELWIERNPNRADFLKNYHIKKTPRVGIKRGREKLWRWVAEPKR